MLTPGRLFSTLLMLAIAVASPADARADFITTGASVNGVGTFQGTVSYASINASTGILFISLTNTSSVGDGGYLTALAVNNPGNQITGAGFLSTDPDFGLIGGSSFDNGIETGTYGDFDLGASVGSTWDGDDGSAPGGLAAGETATFVFLVTGTGLNTLTTEDFLTTYSSNPGDGGEQFLAARFRLNNVDGQLLDDRAAAVVATPEPGSLALGALGLAGVLVGRLRRRKVD